MSALMISLVLQMKHQRRVTMWSLGCFSGPSPTRKVSALLAKDMLMDVLGLSKKGVYDIYQPLRDREFPRIA